MKHQPRLKKGTRDPLPSCVDSRIRAAVQRDALRWNCSRSWIIATALSAFYEIDIPLPHEGRKKARAA